MNSRILRAVIVIAPWILSWRILHDIQAPLLQLAHTPTQSSTAILPLNISASRRDYPSVTEYRGKGFVVISPGDKQSSQTGRLYTARHVISDTGYNYKLSSTTTLTSLYHLSGDTSLAEFSGQIATGSIFKYNTGLSSDQVLIGQYRNNKRNWLTGSVISSDNEGTIIDIPVLPGDSGSPVIFSDKKLGVVSQSHSGNMTIVQKIPQG